MVGFSLLFLQGTLWIRHHNLDAPWSSSGQSPSIPIGQSHESTGHSSSRWCTSTVISINKVTLPLSAPKVGWSGACQKSNVNPLYFCQITPLIIWLTEVGHQTATLYQLADGSAVLKLGLDGILEGIDRVSTYHGPHIGHQFPVVGFTFSLAGRWLKHWAHGIVD